MAREMLVTWSLYILHQTVYVDSFKGGASASIFFIQMVILGIHYRCMQVEALVEMSEEQVSKIFKHANEQEKETMINLLGLEYWIRGSIHDGKMAFDLF